MFDYLVHFHFVKTVLLAAVALLPIVDPLGSAPIYLAMTDGLSSEQRRPLSKAVAVNSFILLIASALIGAYVLDFFGLSIPAVQVAGGMVVSVVAWSLLKMPLTVGPGSMSVALTLGANPEPGLRQQVVTALAHTLGILIVAVSVYLCYRHAERIVKKLGPTGNSVVVRLSAFILLCIGVQIIWNGVHTLLVGAFPHGVP